MPRVRLRARATTAPLPTPRLPDSRHPGNLEKSLFSDTGVTNIRRLDREGFARDEIPGKQERDLIRSRRNTPFMRFTQEMNRNA